ncbi:ScyD/ScyE family protein [Nocardioides sp. HB32]
MTMRRSSIRIAIGAVSAAALLLGSSANAGVLGQQQHHHHDHHISIKPVLSGLAAPRGIAFDSRGDMYVAESGIAGSGTAGLTHTGKVSKYRWGSDTPAWTTRFDSFYASEDPTQPPDVLGPEGLSAMGNGCMKDDDDRHGRDHGDGHHHGCQVQMIMSESTPGILAASNGMVNAPQAGHLYRLDGVNGRAKSISDVGSQMYQWTTDHSDLFPDDFPDSNPFGLLITKGHRGGIRTFVADAGANTISEIMRDGTARVVAYIPNEDFGAMRDSTPTCMAQGPDGYLYVGTLDLVSNLFVPPGTGGFSRVWRVDPNADFPTAPTVWASGLTTITGCTFDRHGNFWAAEMFAGGTTANPPGDVVVIPWRHPEFQKHLGAGKLPLPGMIAQGPDGAMYVTTGSSAPDSAGGVSRISFRH